MKNQNLKKQILNTKESKGITLVTLIITIIILLILAVVAIGAVNNTGIIQYAQNSADEYADGKDKENTTLQNYVDILNHYNSGGYKEELERIYYVEDGAWVDEYVTSESEVPENATITAKFYKTNTLYQPSLPEHWQGEVVLLEEGYAYKLVIDGTGDMPAIVDIDNGTASAWGIEIGAAQENDFGNIIYYLKDVKINGVSSVGKGAFIFTCCIKTCSLSESVKKIETGAFHECGGLQNINLENVTEIGENAFQTTISLKNVTLSNCTKIKQAAFCSSGIESIDLNKATEIGEEAFNDCESLVSITISENITSIGENAFSQCEKLTSIKINKTADEIKAMANYPWGAEGKIYDKDNNLVYSR